MLMRAYLKSPGHSYSLDSDIISIGKGTDNSLVPPPKFKRAGAHIPIAIGKADPYHAIVEKEPGKNCYYLIDLNSAYGTFVNEKRLQNKKVKLCHGDRIQFGHGGMVHEFGLYRDNKHALQVERPPNTVETGSIVDLRIRRPSTSQGSVSSLLGLNDLVRPETAPNRQEVDKHRDFFKVLFSDRAKSVPINARMSNSDSTAEEETKTVSNGRRTFVTTPFAPQDGWSLDGQDLNDFSDRELDSKSSSLEKESLSSPSEPWYVSMLREKEQRLMQMGDELSRLTLAEEESRKKDDIIQDLRHKVARIDVEATKLNHSAAITEKNNEILQMGDKLNGMVVYQQECDRKDQLIVELQEQVVRLEVERQELAKNFEFGEQVRTITPTSLDTREEWKTTYENPSEMVEQFQGDLVDINTSLQLNRDELDEFRKQLNLPIPDRRSPQEVVVELVSELELKQDVISQLKRELNETKHERNLSDGLSHALQRDLVRGQQTISKLTTALEKSQKETLEASTKAKSMSNKFANLKEEIKHEGILASMERNFFETQERLKDCQQQLSKQQQKFDKQSKELRRANRQTKQHVEKGKLLQSQAEELQAEILDLKQQEQKSRVLSEHTSARLERLRSKIIQAVYTAPGAIKPESRLSDSDILSAIQKIINDRSGFHQQLCDLGQQMPPLITMLDTQSEDSSDVEVPTTNVEKKQGKTTKKSGKK